MVDIRIGDPFYDNRDPRVHLHHSAPPSDGESLGGMSARARGLMGGAFMGCVMAQQSKPADPYHGYISNGLIAYWDGIDNTGNGDSAHSSSATIWKDLAGNHDFNLSSSATWDSDGLNFDYDSAICPTSFSDSDIMTIEASFIRVSSFCILSFTSTNKRAIIADNNYGCEFNPNRNSVSSVRRSIAYGEDYTLRSYAATWDGGDDPSAGYTNGTSASIVKWTDWPGMVAMKLSHASGTYWAKGKLRYVRLYSRALSAEEIAANHAIDQQRFGLA